MFNYLGLEVDQKSAGSGAICGLAVFAKYRAYTIHSHCVLPNLYRQCRIRVVLVPDRTFASVRNRFLIGALRDKVLMLRIRASCTGKDRRTGQREKGELACRFIVAPSVRASAWFSARTGAHRRTCTQARLPEQAGRFFPQDMCVGEPSPAIGRCAFAARAALLPSDSTGDER